MNERPRTLHDIAATAESLEDFGQHFQDWLHALRTWTSRRQVEAAIAAAPPRLSGRFTQGGVADAWLAAYAEYIAGQIGRPVPVWTRGRSSPEPWFAVTGDDPRLRIAALRDSPPAFKARDLYTPTVDLPLRLKAGRPAKTPEERRRANADRQRRFRARRQLQLALLRHATEQL